MFAINKQHVLKKLTPQIELSEGFRSRPYKDSKGYWTIGYGLLLEQRLPDYVLYELNDDYATSFNHATDLRAAKRTEMYCEMFNRDPLSQKTAHNIMTATLSELYDQVDDKMYKKNTLYLYHFKVPQQLVILDIAYNAGVNGLFGFKGFIEALMCDNLDHAIGELLISKRAARVYPRTKHNCETLLGCELNAADCYRCTITLLGTKYAEAKHPQEYYVDLVNTFTEKCFGRKIYLGK